MELVKRTVVEGINCNLLIIESQQRQLVALPRLELSSPTDPMKPATVTKTPRRTLVISQFKLIYFHNTSHWLLYAVQATNKIIFQ